MTHAPANSTKAGVGQQRVQDVRGPSLPGWKQRLGSKVKPASEIPRDTIPILGQPPYTRLTELTLHRLPPLLLTTLLLSGLTLGITVAHGNTPPPWTVSLDANSTSTIDATIQSSNNPTNTFTVGAIINASNLQPVTNIYAWQFAITYDNTSLTPDNNLNGPQNGIQFGAQSTTGHPNWAGQITAGKGFGSSTISSIDNTHRKITVFFTLLGANPLVTISPAIQGNLLANVNFTILHNSTSPLTLTITDVQFLDNNTNTIPNINHGSPITETVSGNPTQSQNLLSGTLLYLIIALAATALVTLLVVRRKKHPETPGQHVPLALKRKQTRESSPPKGPLSRRCDWDYLQNAPSFATSS